MRGARKRLDSIVVGTPASGTHGKVHAAEQILETWVRVQAVKPGFDQDEGHIVGSCLISFLQEFDCMVLLSEVHIKLGNVVG